MTPYRCKYCSRIYKLKKNYDKHYLFCDTLNKSMGTREPGTREPGTREPGTREPGTREPGTREPGTREPGTREPGTRELKDHVPSLRDMFTLILELTAKNSQLEQKVDELSKWAESKKKKLNVIDWLNEKYTTTIKYTDWLAGINITRNHLDLVFKSDMVNGCNQILQSLLDTHETNRPIKAFDQKENVLFIYNETNQWEMLEPSMFAKLMNILSKKILTEFIKWQTENKDKMYHDEFSYMYARNLQKIMGGNLTQEQINTRIKRDLYNYLKMNLRNVVEYEFSF
jgi:hypothetical protein